MGNKALIFGAVLAAAVPAGAQAAEVIIGAGAPHVLTTTVYTQNFNSMKSVTNDGVSNDSLPSGWQAVESGTGANGTYNFGSASSATVGVWSYGSGTDRALGGRTNSEVETIHLGAIFENGLGGVIDGLGIQYVGEQWQNGFNRAAMQFEYSLDATSLSNGTWVAFSGLDFLAPNNAAHVGSQFGIGSTNGNNGAFRTPVSGTLGGLAIGTNDTFAVRWTMNDVPGFETNDGLAIDDFRLTASLAPVSAVPEPATWAMMIGGFGAIGATMRRRQRQTVRFA